ncbi:MAG: glycosyltransferase family 2 protein [Betaproteobacteria bacterium]|nr:glycosyltransferase family 2 protein [Betaproteobacteria bacterium]
MKPLIDLSIIIPTYKRKELLTCCLESISKQDVLPNEIVIGNDCIEDPIDAQEIQSKYPFNIKVLNRTKPLGQSKNVNDLINKVQSNWTMLIHDDDLLIENSLQKFFNTTKESSHGDLFFGMQKLLKNNKLQTDDEALEFNKKFHRDPSKVLPSSFELVSQHTIPSNGFIIKTDLLKKIGYCYQLGLFNYGLIKDACDYGFTWKCYLNNINFIFVPNFVSIYRITDISVSSKKNVTILESFLVELDILLKLKPSRFENKKQLKNKIKKRYLKSLKTAIRLQNWSLFITILCSKFKYRF